MRIAIKDQRLPSRCDVCHQSDLFDAVNNSCARCEMLAGNFQISLTNKRSRKLLNYFKASFSAAMDIILGPICFLVFTALPIMGVFIIICSTLKVLMLPGTLLFDFLGLAAKYLLTVYTIIGFFIGLCFFEESKPAVVKAAFKTMRLSVIGIFLLTPLCYFFTDQQLIPALIISTIISASIYRFSVLFKRFLQKAEKLSSSNRLV